MFASQYPGIQESWNACYRETFDSAVAQGDRPMLTTLREHSISLASR
jgi:hypothetical protein